MKHIAHVQGNGLCDSTRTNDTRISSWTRRANALRSRGRGDLIRTSDLMLPKHAHYQAVLRPACWATVTHSGADSSRKAVPKCTPSIPPGTGGIAATAVSAQTAYVAIVIELLIPAMAFGVLAWWLWLRSRGHSGVDTETLAELRELRAFREEAERRLETLETIATTEDPRTESVVEPTHER